MISLSAPAPTSAEVTTPKRKRKRVTMEEAKHGTAGWERGMSEHAQVYESDVYLN